MAVPVDVEPDPLQAVLEQVHSLAARLEALERELGRLVAREARRDPPAPPEAGS